MGSSKILTRVDIRDDDDAFLYGEEAATSKVTTAAGKTTLTVVGGLLKTSVSLSLNAIPTLIVVHFMCVCDQCPPRESRSSA